MKKRKSNNKVLVVAIVLALVIVIGATFAWYTSKDEVTNKLSATNDYNVSITETYTPETSWTPGEEVNKDVAIVNTGSTAALVRAYFDGQFVITNKSVSESAFGTQGKEFLKMGTYDTNATAETKTKTMREEAFKAEAGGYLVYAAGYTNSIVATATSAADRNPQIDVNTNNWVKFDALKYDENNANQKTIAEAIDSTTSGFYIFARVQKGEEGETITYTYEYDGYYFDAANKEYYKIAIEPIATGSLTLFDGEKKVNAKLYETSQVLIDTSNNGVTVNYDNSTAGSEKLVVTYTDASNKNIIINIGLTNIGTGADKWTELGTGKAATFYYNEVVYGGQTTKDLVDFVELDSSVDGEAYLAFDYYLNVHSDSIQAVNGKAADVTVAGGWAANSGFTTINTAAKGTGTTVVDESNQTEAVVAWSAVS